MADDQPLDRLIGEAQDKTGRREFAIYAGMVWWGTLRARLKQEADRGLIEWEEARTSPMQARFDIRGNAATIRRLSDDLEQLTGGNQPPKPAKAGWRARMRKWIKGLDPAMVVLVLSGIVLVAAMAWLLGTPRTAAAPGAAAECNAKPGHLYAYVSTDPGRPGTGVCLKVTPQ